MYNGKNEVFQEMSFLFLEKIQAEKWRGKRCWNCLRNSNKEHWMDAYIKIFCLAWWVLFGPGEKKNYWFSTCELRQNGLRQPFSCFQELAMRTKTRNMKNCRFSRKRIVERAKIFFCQRWRWNQSMTIQIIFEQLYVQGTWTI